MLPPALIRPKRFLLALAALFPITLLSTGSRVPLVQARLAATSNSTPLSDGIYLYGNSPKANQVAQDYVVFERHQGKVVGAFYSPQSEFTCFAGNLKGTQLEVEEQTPEVTKPQPVQAELAQLYPLPTLSANDHRILRQCQQATIAVANSSQLSQELVSNSP